jgi:uncharacterized protein YcfL
MNKSKFKVQVERTLLAKGVIEVEASDAASAVARVKRMIREGLQTADKRVYWYDADYVDFSFQATGECRRGLG